LGITTDHLLSLGRSPDSPDFNMTALAIRGSRFHNGVSTIHGEVSSKICSKMWPQIDPEENPVGHVTNGVHPTFWMAPPAQALFDRYVSIAPAQDDLRRTAERLSAELRAGGVPNLGPLGQGQDNAPGLGPLARRSGEGDAAAGTFDQDIEGILDQSDVATVRADHRPQGQVRQGDEFLASRHQAVSRMSSPAREFCCPLVILTGTIRPISARASSTWTD